MRLTHRYILAVCASITVIVFYVGFILPSNVTIINKTRYNFLRNGLKKIPKLRKVTGYLRNDVANGTIDITHRVRHRPSGFGEDDNLIDSYGKNDLTKTGEMGRGVIFVGDEKISATKSVEEYRVNVFASDLIPLNRMVPDSRHAQ